MLKDLASHAVAQQLPDKGKFVKNTFSPSLTLSAIEDKAEEALQQKVKEKKSKQDLYYQLDEYIKSKKER